MTSHFKKQSYRLPSVLNAMYNSDLKVQYIVQAPQLTPDEKSAAVYLNELRHFLTLQIQLQNQFQVQTNLQTQLQRTTPNLPEASKTPEQYPSTVPCHTILTYNF